MVNAGVVLVARIGPIFYFAMVANPGLVQPFFLTVAWIGAITAFLMATQGMVGFELKKILAYSTASQIGYMMMALGITGLSSDFAQGLSAGLFHLTSHAIFKACLFMAAGVLINATGTKYVSGMGGLRHRMKLTFVVFLIAAASLSGIPPFSGFWSKDAVLATAWDAGQWGLFAVGALTAGITAFYTFRMFGLIFFGVGSEKRDDRPPHEAGPLGWAPYAILGAMTVIIGLLAPFLNIETALEQAANSYLQGLFPASAVLTSPSVKALAFNAESAAIALAFVLVGSGAAFVFYIARRVEPSTLVGQTGLMRGLHTFLENRWYINAIYYRVFVDPAISGSRWLLNQFEVNGLEKVNGAAAAFGIYLSKAGNWVDSRVIDTIAREIAIDGESLSRWFRRAQSGILEQYALIFSVGLLFLLIAYLFATGVLSP
jgi:NADH-quinone oxidoreductase subunit L